MTTSRKMLRSLNIFSQLLLKEMYGDYSSSNFTCVNKTEVMHERPRANAKVERGSTLTFTHDPPFIASILFTREKFTCISTLNSLLMMSLGAGALKVIGEPNAINREEVSMATLEAGTTPRVATNRHRLLNNFSGDTYALSARFTRVLVDFLTGRQKKNTCVQGTRCCGSMGIPYRAG